MIRVKQKRLSIFLGKGQLVPLSGFLEALASFFFSSCFCLSPHLVLLPKSVRRPAVYLGVKFQQYQPSNSSKGLNRVSLYRCQRRVFRYNFFFLVAALAIFSYLVSRAPELDIYVFTFGYTCGQKAFFQSLSWALMILLQRIKYIQSAPPRATALEMGKKEHHPPKRAERPPKDKTRNPKLFTTYNWSIH